jgi:hypothetical protein
MKDSAEEISREVASARRRPGQQVYDEAFAAAANRLAQGTDAAQIRLALVKPMKPCEPNGLPLIVRQLNAMHRELARIRQPAVEDAIAGRQASFSAD